MDSSFLGAYEHTADLLASSACRSGSPTRLPRELMVVHTPLAREAWEKSLATHPDQKLAALIVAGLKEGFRIGFDYHLQCKAVHQNMASARAHPEAVTKYIEECEKRRVIGPLRPESLPQVHVSPFGVIPKGSTGKWCLIVNLSAPEGMSVNDGIEKNCPPCPIFRWMMLHGLFWS